jgi:hypothetical protein
LNRQRGWKHQVPPIRRKLYETWHHIPEDLDLKVVLSDEFVEEYDHLGYKPALWTFRRNVRLHLCSLRARRNRIVLSTVTAVKTVNRIEFVCWLVGRFVSSIVRFCNPSGRGLVRGPRSVAIFCGIMGSKANQRSIRQSLELRKWGVNSLKPGDRERERREEVHVLYESAYVMYCIDNLREENSCRKIFEFPTSV